MPSTSSSPQCRKDADARHEAGHDRRRIPRLTAFRFWTIFLIALSRSRGALMRRHWCGERYGACCRGSRSRHRDGTGPRLRPLRAGARSSLTERPWPHEKRGPSREIAELVCANGAGSFAGAPQGARLPQGRPVKDPLRRTGAPAPSVFPRAVMEECPGA